MTCFLFLRQVIPRRMVMDVLSFGRFVSISTTAITVIKLSSLLQRFHFFIRIAGFCCCLESHFLLKAFTHWMCFIMCITCILNCWRVSWWVSSDRIQISRCGKQRFYFSDPVAIFLNFCSVNKQIIQSQPLCGTVVTSPQQQHFLLFCCLRWSLEPSHHRPKMHLEPGVPQLFCDSLSLYPKPSQCPVKMFLLIS